VSGGGRCEKAVVEGRGGGRLRRAV
jgi:hypothetical protein